MIDDAAAMGLEMFVLDDGWFGNKYRSSVLLPEPDSPTIATYSPFGTEKLTSFNALTAVSPLP